MREPATMAAALSLSSVLSSTRVLATGGTTPVASNATAMKMLQRATMASHTLGLQRLSLARHLWLDMLKAAAAGPVDKYVTPDSMAKRQIIMSAESDVLSGYLEVQGPYNPN